MSLIKAIKAQLGLSVTSGNNFTLDASADNGTMKLARGNAGATTQDLITVSANNVITGAPGATLAGNGPAFTSKLSANQTGYTSGIDILFNSDTHDTNNAFANGVFQPNVAGFYSLNANVYLRGNAAISNIALQFKKNGATHLIGGYFPAIAGGVEVIPSISGLVYMNGATDYLTLGVIFVGGGVVYVDAFTSLTYFQGFLARAA